MYFKRCAALLLLGLSLQVHAQSDPPKKATELPVDMNEVQVVPEFPGGEPALKQFFVDNLQYPAIARDHGIQGTVVVGFIVDETGRLLEFRVIKDIGAGCGKETLRLLHLMPNWKPGEMDGIPVKVRYTLPVRFSLEDRDSIDPLTVSEGTQPLSSEKILAMVLEAAKNIGKLQSPAMPETPFSADRPADQKLLAAMEFAFKTVFSEADKKSFTRLDHVSEYVYRSQYAPVFYSGENFHGHFTKLLTDRADFDANADGTGKIGALKLPQGIRLILYSKKNFKGKKLEIDASAAALEIADMGAIPSGRANIKDQGKGIHWGLSTKSIKIKLPKNFPAQ